MEMGFCYFKQSFYELQNKKKNNPENFLSPPPPPVIAIHLRPRYVVQQSAVYSKYFNFEIRAT